MKWLRFIEQHLSQQFLPIIRSKRSLTAEQFVQRRSERIHVGPMIDWNPTGHRLFGAHVSQRAQEITSGRQALLALNLSQSEVRDPEFVVAIDEQI